MFKSKDAESFQLLSLLVFKTMTIGFLSSSFYNTAKLNATYPLSTSNKIQLMASRKRRPATTGRPGASSSTPQSTEPYEPSKRTRLNPTALSMSISTTHIDRILQAEEKMSDYLSSLTFRSPVTHVYNPLVYAWAAHEWYVRSYAKAGVKVMLVGMNPGPWGMAQTGVPFGEVEAVKDFLQMPLDITINKPSHEHPARPVEGLQCARSEVSGRRLWREFAAPKFDNDPHSFSENYYVHNYCPLMFMEGKGGRNRTPVQLPAAERRAIEYGCDEGLRSVVHALRPTAVCGIGAYARDRCEKVLAKEIEEGGLCVGLVLHPSPASPAANKGWVEKAVKQLDDLNEMVEKSEKDWTDMLNDDNDDKRL